MTVRSTGPTVGGPLSLGRLLRRHAAEHPQKNYKTFLDHEGRITRRLTFSGLERSVGLFACLLRQRFPPKSAVFLVMETGPEFDICFLALVEAGMIAIPLPPIDPLRPESSCRFLSRLASETDAVAVLATGAQAKVLKNPLPNLEGCRELELIDAEQAIAREEAEHGTSSPGSANRNPKDPLALLYTSGSTSAPKGVVLREPHLLYNGRTCCDCWQIHGESLLATWMPNHHSFGLIYNLVLPLMAGCETVAMAPAAFLKNPALWLNTIGQYSATHGAAATFGYQYCCDRVRYEDVREVDLSSWKVGLVSAEPVRRGVYDAFLSKFRGLGLRQNFFCALYGLSETGPITSMPAGRPPVFLKDAKLGKDLWLACVGKPFPGTRLICVGPETGLEVGPGETGEVWISGPSVMDGYFKHRETDATVFGRIPGRSESYFRTGDLGFMEAGKLFITGRLKEVIIVRGKNHYPQDIEWIAKRADPAFARLSAAAFALDEAPRIAVILEIPEKGTPGPDPADYPNLCRAAARAVSEELGIAVAEIGLVPAGTVPKTASGKIQRASARNAWLAERLPLVHRAVLLGKSGSGKDRLAQPETGLELLLGLLAKTLGQPESDLDPDQPLSRLSLDSVHYLQLGQDIEERWGVALHPTVFFKVETPRELAEHLERMRDS